MSGGPILTAHMEDAVAASLRHVEAGGLPFVGVVVTADGRVGHPGVNRVLETGDPTAHAEVVAIREALAEWGDDAVRGATLLATGEPCAFCYRFAADHGIAAVHYAVGRDSAAVWGFDYREGYASYGTDRLPLAVAARHLPVRDGLAPFVRHHAAHPTH